MAGVFKAIQPLDYLKYFLEEKIRPDGRELLKGRPASINIGSITTADGSSLVRIGNTAVVCGVKSQLADPSEDAQGKGLISINVDLPPLCSSQFKPGPPSEQALVTTQLLVNIIKNSECLKLEDLCIAEGKLVWHISLNLMCLDYDGNILDACLMAVTAALKNVKLPEVHVEDDRIDKRENTVPLTLHSCPVSTTFAIFDPSIIILDPTQEEEKLAAGLITITALQDGQLCGVFKSGGRSMSDEMLIKCIRLAKERCKEVTKIIDKATKNGENP